MEAYYILIVAVLFLLAISDLIVGVSNDAVNFLNSAIGSNAAKFQVILIIAAAGVLVGAVFSQGMMEVARKGIFHPGMFSFEDIMVVFLAVMLTDILLLDFFNTIGLPTSTTVSIVFELLGSAVAIAVYRLAKSGAENTMSSYINTDSAMLIISGIFLSVIIAFTVGLIIMALVRFAFSFNYIKTNKYWGGIWGGFAITAILYFLLIKGAKGSMLVSGETIDFLKHNTFKILLISFFGWTLILQLLIMFTRVNVLKVTVLIGTFALAMAFAGNDLVNFIGVPIAGFKSFQAYISSGSGDPSSFMMSALGKKVDTPLYFLIIAGMIMVITLKLSKKARSVTATTLNLSRQGEGSERFESIGLARFIVRRTVEVSNYTKKIAPGKFEKFRASRFDDSKGISDYKKNKISFDLVRASVNLVVASILIAIGTSLKLPLSTTYVTFMVAMGTSLADGAWGRESAVYRITGVLTVIGGWFFTAFSAFSAAFILATVIFFGKLPVIIALIALAIFIMLRTHAFHKRKSEEDEKKETQKANETYQQIIVDCDNEVKSAVIQVSKLLFLTYNGFAKEKLKDLKTVKKQGKSLNKSIKEMKDNLPGTLKKFQESDIDTGHFYVQVVDHLKETSNSLNHIILPAFRHIDNNHPLDQEQSKELKEFNDITNQFFNFAISMFQQKNFDKMDELVKQKDLVIDNINEIIKNRIKILKKTQKGSKVSITYIDMLTETKNLILHIVQLIKATGHMKAY